MIRSRVGVPFRDMDTLNPALLPDKEQQALVEFRMLTYLTSCKKLERSHFWTGASRRSRLPPTVGAVTHCNSNCNLRRKSWFFFGCRS